MNTLIARVAKTAVLALVAMMSFSAAGVTLSKQTVPKASQLTQSYVWYDGNRQQTVWLNPQALAEFNPSKLGTSAAKNTSPNAKVWPLKRSQAGIRVWKVDNAGGTALRGMMVTNPVGKYSPVFHDSASSSGAMRALPGNIIVYLNPTWDATMVNDWIAARKLEVVKKLEAGPNIYVIKTGVGLEALNTANQLYLSGEVAAAFPDWWQEVSAR